MIDFIEGIVFGIFLMWFVRYLDAIYARGQEPGEAAGRAAGAAAEREVTLRALYDRRAVLTRAKRLGSTPTEGAHQADLEQLIDEIEGRETTAIRARGQEPGDE